MAVMRNCNESIHDLRLAFDSPLFRFKNCNGSSILEFVTTKTHAGMKKLKKLKLAAFHGNVRTVISVAIPKEAE